MFKKQLPLDLEPEIVKVYSLRVNVSLDSIGNRPIVEAYMPYSRHLCRLGICGFDVSIKLLWICYVTFGSLLSQIRLSVVCNVHAPYTGG